VSVRIGDHEFEHVIYDEPGDVLYLSNDASPDVTVTTYGTPEGHAVRLDASGRILGMTIVNARWLVERDGELAISIPQQRIEAAASDVCAALEQSMST
jgi:uncharacterized protein YuzE